MTIAILAEENIRKEISAKGVNENVDLIWADTLQSLRIIEADAYFDLQFENDNERISRLKFLSPKPIFVNDVVGSQHPFIRINAWSTMLSRPTIELAGEHHTEAINEVMSALGWKYQLVPNIPGMITPRIVSMIVNEAYYALGEEVSSRQDIDVAMKLGTNYPFGPFEWSDRIGLEKIVTLLRELARTDKRYELAALLNNYK